MYLKYKMDVVSVPIVRTKEIYKTTGEDNTGNTR